MHAAGQVLATLAKKRGRRPEWLLRVREESRSFAPLRRKRSAGLQTGGPSLRQDGACHQGDQRYSAKRFHPVWWAAYDAWPLRMTLSFFFMCFGEPEAHVPLRMTGQGTLREGAGKQGLWGGVTAAPQQNPPTPLYGK